MANSQTLLKTKTVKKTETIWYLKKKIERDVTSTNWLDNVISTLQTTGEADALNFVTGNYSIFISLGLDITNMVLTMFTKGKPDIAQMILDAKMSPDQIDIQINVISADMAVSTQQREQFIADLEKFAEALLPVVIKVGMAVATGGLGI